MTRNEMITKIVKVLENENYKTVSIVYSAVMAIVYGIPERQRGAKRKQGG